MLSPNLKKESEDFTKHIFSLGVEAAAIHLEASIPFFHEKKDQNLARQIVAQIRNLKDG